MEQRICAEEATKSRRKEEDEGESARRTKEWGKDNKERTKANQTGEKDEAVNVICNGHNSQPTDDTSFFHPLIFLFATHLSKTLRSTENKHSNYWLEIFLLKWISIFIEKEDLLIVEKENIMELDNCILKINDVFWICMNNLKGIEIL